MNQLLRLLRTLLGVPAPQVTAEEALGIAHAEAAKRQARAGRMVVREGIRNWTVWIDAESKGSPVVKIDNRSGEIVKWASLPR